MRKALVLVAALLVGCETTPVAPPVVPPVSEKITYEPPMPKPLQFCDVKWKVLVVDNQPYVALSYEDNINFAVCAKDLEKYISEVNLVVCHYRQCSKEENARK
jgi:hypothetical protein